MTAAVGSTSNPLRVAVVGSGPAGMYAAAALIGTSDLEVRVDVLERLPAPFGLVRYGVAPDHQKIKRVQRVFDRSFEDERIRFLGNVELGRDVTRAELRSSYHQIVYAVGAQGDRRLGIGGEDLPGSWSSTEFVNWYNGHPDLATADYPVDVESVAVVGIGNVAMDVARILATDPEALAATDISDRALQGLARNRVRTVHVLARRGPVQAKCSPPELKELGELKGVSIGVNPADLELDEASERTLADDRAAEKNLALLREFLATEPSSSERCRIHLHFLTSPRELVAEEGAIVAVRCERNRLVELDGGYLNAEGTGEFFDLPVQRVVRAIGYRSDPLVDLPYDERRGVIPNLEGRVRDGDRVLTGEYVVGWVKRGPSGLIGSNKADAKATVESMVEDARRGEHLQPTLEGLEAHLVAKEHRVVNWSDWQRIESAENSRGEAAGRPRVKFLTVEEMLSVLD